VTALSSGQFCVLFFLTETDEGVFWQIYCTGMQYESGGRRSYEGIPEFSPSV
jgi:hypothetical protein